MDAGWKKAVNRVCVLILLCAVVLSVMTTYTATKLFLDGDASGELVLAQRLAQEKKLLSEDWYYSTELRVVNTQLIYAPLMALFSDWHRVRFVGALLMQGMLAIAFWILSKQLRLSLQARCIGSALMILPTSVAYGRIVLYHTYYAPHILLSFAIVSLYLSATSKRKNGWTIGCLLGVSFLSGLGGIRQFVITQAPLVLLSLYGACEKGKDKPVSEILKDSWRSVVLAILTTVAFALGFLVNDRVLSAKYSFESYAELSLNLRNLTKIPDVLYGFLHQFGFRTDVKVISLVGVMSLLGLFTAGVVAYHGIRALKKPWGTDSETIISRFMMASLLSVVGVSMLTGSADSYTRYLIPATVWAVPMLSMAWHRWMDHPKRIGVPGVAMLLAIGILFGNALINAGYFQGHKIGFRQKYEGLYENDQLVDQLKNPLAVIEEKGYLVGYGTRWESCTLAEMSDGHLTVIPVCFSQDHARMQYEEWLAFRSDQDIVPTRTFLMLPTYLEKYYMQLPMDDLGELIYQDEIYVVYGFENGNEWFQYLHH